MSLTPMLPRVVAFLLTISVTQSATAHNLLGGPPAGIAAYACMQTGAYYLLAFDPGQGRQAWGHLGGRAEAKESPSQTALREFREESNCAFDLSQTGTEHLKGPSTFSTGGFHTYVLQVPFVPASQIALPRVCKDVERKLWVWIRHSDLLMSLRIDGAVVDVADGEPRQITLWTPARRSLLKAMEDGILPLEDPCK